MNIPEPEQDAPEVEDSDSRVDYSITDIAEMFSMCLARQEYQKFQ